MWLIELVVNESSFHKAACCYHNGNFQSDFSAYFLNERLCAKAQIGLPVWVYSCERLLPVTCQKEKKKKENPLFHAFPNSSLISSDFPFCFILCRNLEFNISIKDVKPNCFLYKLPKEPNNRVNVHRASFILTGCITFVTWDSVQGNDKVRHSPTKNILTATP